MDVLADSHLWVMYEQVTVDPHRYRLRRSLSLASLTCSSQALKTGLVGTLALGMILSSLATAWATTAYISTPPGYALNVRWGPGTGYGIHRKLLRGTAIQLTGRYRNGWAELIDGTWVAGNFISASGANGAGGIRGNAYVTTPSGNPLNARWGPGTRYGIYRAIPQGTQVELSGRTQGDWVQLMDTTWVYGRYLAISGGGGTAPAPRPVPNRQVEEAQVRLQQLGYLSAAYRPNGLYDETTVAALRTFQRVNGLPETGTLDAYTARALYNSTQAAPNYTPTPGNPPSSPSPSPSPTASSGAQQQMRVSTGGDTALVFSGPGSEYDLVTTLADGTVVTTTGRTVNTWTELTNGGWIFSMWLAPL